MFNSLFHLFFIYIKRRFPNQRILGHYLQCLFNYFWIKYSSLHHLAIPRPICTKQLKSLNSFLSLQIVVILIFSSPLIWTPIKKNFFLFVRCGMHDKLILASLKNMNFNMEPEYIHKKLPGENSLISFTSYETRKGICACNSFSFINFYFLKKREKRLPYSFYLIVDWRKVHQHHHQVCNKN